MDHVTFSPWQTLAECHQRDGIGRLRQASDQRHGIGGAAEQICPLPLAIGRYLIRQDANRFTLFQGLEQGAHALHAGWRQFHLAARPTGMDQ